jgi:hypothetical protein
MSTSIKKAFKLLQNANETKAFSGIGLSTCYTPREFEIVDSLQIAAV